MNALTCFGEKTTSLVVGTLLILIGIMFVIAGLTVLPIIGFIVAVPAFVGSYPLLRSAFKEACEYYEKEPGRHSDKIKSR